MPPSFVAVVHSNSHYSHHPHSSPPLFINDDGNIDSGKTACSDASTATAAMADDDEDADDGDDSDDGRDWRGDEMTE